MFINEDFFDDVDDEIISNNDIDDVTEESEITPEKYEYLFVIKFVGFATLSPDKYYMFDRVKYFINMVLDQHRFITNHSFVDIVSINEDNVRNYPGYIKPSPFNFIQAGGNIIFGINCNVRYAKQILKFISDIHNIIIHKHLFAMSNMQIFKRTPDNVYNHDINYALNFCYGNSVSEYLADKEPKKISKHDMVMFTAFIDLVFLFSKTINMYEQLCDMFNISMRHIIYKSIQADMNQIVSDCPTGDKHMFKLPKQITNNIIGKKVGANVENVCKRNFDLNFHMIPNVMQVSRAKSSYVNTLKQKVYQEMSSGNISIKDVYTIQLDNCSRLFLCCDCGVYQIDDKVINVSISCFMSTTKEINKNDWKLIFDYLTDDKITDEEYEKFWIKLKPYTGI